MSLSSFFAPQSVAVVGASENPDKLGSIILQNILDAQFPGRVRGVNPKHSGETLFGVPFLSALSDEKEAFDLAVIVVPAPFTKAVVQDAIVNKTKSIILISAGFGEVGNTELEHEISNLCHEHGINLLGPNCLGAIFPYAKLNASFSDGFPKEGNICFVSQSGAFCTAVLDWAMEKGIGFSHFLSLGNKAGISEDQVLEYLAHDPKVEIFAFYLESLHNGKRFIELIEKISNKKPVVILQPGRSAKAMEASASHTGSLAPNARVLEAAYKKAGAIQVFSMREMFGVIKVLSFAPGKKFGRRLGIITNAGGVGVEASDLTEDNHLELVNFSPELLAKLKAALPAEANIKNPIDIIGDARTDRYNTALQILSDSDEVDQMLVLLTPQRTTEIEKTADCIADWFQKTDENIIASFVGGTKVRKGINILRDRRTPAFRFSVEAIRTMALLANRTTQMHRKPLVRDFFPPSQSALQTLLEEAKEKGEKSLSAAATEEFLREYELDTPLSYAFPVTEKEKAKVFAQSFFPDQKVVVKLSAPSALHKTEMRGVFLDISDTELFEEAWESLAKAIINLSIPEAKILIQEQIPKGAEVIVGIHTDSTFGKILLFGGGGVYTEVFQDTTLEILPDIDIPGMIRRTKIGKIILGVRGESPKAVSAIQKTMQRIAYMAEDFPDIVSVDMNPIFVTDDRAICADVKILVS
ncbi:MAG: acetate--CoA ligase family protein [Candidatus Peregrinibacteria bacterium]